MRTNSQSHWAHQFPGTGIAINSMRESLAAAAHQLRWHKANLDPLNRSLRLTGLPLFLWNPETLRIYKYFHRQYLSAQKQFHQALRFIQRWSPECRSPKSEKNFSQPNHPLSSVPQGFGESRPLNLPTERHLYGKN